MNWFWFSVASMVRKKSTTESQVKYEFGRNEERTRMDAEGLSNLTD
ncbi:MAG: hypothetical protein P8J52_07025 [Gammaproteobacteria bacterium]|nr:hypothetical protein [Gammaproteobacteria bacterium]